MRKWEPDSWFSRLPFVLVFMYFHSRPWWLSFRYSFHFRFDFNFRLPTYSNFLMSSQIVNYLQGLASNDIQLSCYNLTIRNGISRNLYYEHSLRFWKLLSPTKSPPFLALVLLLWCLFQQEDTVHEVITIFCKLVEVVSETGSFNR